MEDHGALLCTWWPQAMRAQPWPLAQWGGTVGFSMELVTPLPWPHAVDQRGGHGAAATCRERGCLGASICTAPSTPKEGGLQ